MKWKALLVLLGSFLLGAGGGLLFDHVVLHPKKAPRHITHPPHRIAERLAVRLKLSQSQQKEVHTILQHAHMELWTLRQEMNRRMVRTLETAKQRISETLQPEQRATFQRILSEHRAYRQHWRGYNSKWYYESPMPDESHSP